MFKDQINSCWFLLLQMHIISYSVSFLLIGLAWYLEKRLHLFLVMVVEVVFVVVVMEANMMAAVMYEVLVVVVVVVPVVDDGYT